MRMLKLSFTILALVTVLTFPRWVHACPSCADAPAAAGSEYEDPSRNQAAYNNSIYVMVGVPYFSLGLVTFFIYRGMKKNEQFRQALRDHAEKQQEQI
jgi:hypothetical protein